MMLENYYDEEPDLEVKHREPHVHMHSPLFYFVMTLLLAVALLTAGVVLVPRYVAAHHPEVYDILGGNDTENYGVRGENKQTIEANPNQNSNSKQATSSAASDKQINTGVRTVK